METTRHASEGRNPGTIGADREARKATAGFTLLELLVVLTIIGLITAISVPVFGGVVPKYRGASAARELISDLRSARGQAVAGRVPVAVMFAPDQRDYVLDGKTHRLTVKMAVSVDDAEIPPGARATLHFYADGSCDPILIALGDEGRRTVVRTDWLTGRAYADGE